MYFISQLSSIANKIESAPDTNQIKELCLEAENIQKIMRKETKFNSLVILDVDFVTAHLFKDKDFELEVLRNHLSNNVKTLLRFAKRLYK